VCVRVCVCVCVCSHTRTCVCACVCVCTYTNIHISAERSETEREKQRGQGRETHTQTHTINPEIALACGYYVHASSPHWMGRSFLPVGAFCVCTYEVTAHIFKWVTSHIQMSLVEEIAQILYKCICSVLPCVVVCCSALQRVAACGYMHQTLVRWGVLFVGRCILRFSTLSHGIYI